jgi:hypothetical protein
MESQERQATVQLALAQIVGDFGRKVSDDPVRLRNLMVDATGVHAMTLSAEIEAVVAVAESRLPDTVLFGDETQRAEATQRLATVLGPDRGELAGWATETWSTVLRSAPARPTATLTGTTADATALPGATVGAATVMSGATVVAGDTVRLAPTGDGAPPAGGPTDKRQLMVIGGFVGLLVLVAIIILATRGGGDDTTASPSSTVASGADTSDGDRDRDDTTGTTVPGGPIIPPIEPIAAPLSVADGVTGERAITPGEGATTIELSFTNSSGQAFDGYWIEVVPDAFGRSGVDAAQLGAIDIGRTAGTAFGVPVTLTAGESATVTYTTPWVPVDAADLGRTADDFELALQAWITEHGDPRVPTLTLTSAATSQTDAFDLTGTTDAENTVTVNGQVATIGADGSFVFPVQLAAGANSFEVVATSLLGVEVASTGTVTYEAPVPTTQPIVNSAPTLECVDETVTIAGYYESYYFGVPESCFADADLDFVLIYSDIGDGAVGECGEGWACWLYTVSPDWDGTPMEVTATIWAEDPDLAQSPLLKLTLCLNC